MYIKDEGPHDAKIMLVGESFEDSEDILLKQMLNHVGIYHHECKILTLNLFGGGYLDKKKTKPDEELLKIQKTIRDKIDSIKPNIVIALGNEAMKAITNKRGISKWRGFIQQYNGTKVIATYHPSYVMRIYEHHVVVEMDLAKALTQSLSRELKYDMVDISKGLPLQQTLSWLEVAKRQERVAFDLETIDLHIRCIGIAYRDKNITRAISIPFMKFKSADMMSPNRLLTQTVSSDLPVTYWNERDEMQLLDKIAEIIESSSIQKVGQNSICFDSPILIKDFQMETVNHYFDTMHAWHLLYSELPMSLDFLASTLLNYPQYSAEKITESDESEWTYNAYDAAATLDASYKIETEIRQNGMWEKYREIHRLATAISTMQDRGVLIDLEKRAKIKKEQEAKLKLIEARLSKLVSSTFNPNSPKQVAELLYKKLGLPLMKKKGSMTTDEAALKKLASKFPKVEAISMIIDYRKTQKLMVG
jgi:uracil-DNA glycosylase family 4